MADEETGNLIATSRANLFHLFRSNLFHKLRSPLILPPISPELRHLTHSFLALSPGYRGDNDPIDAIEIGSKVQHHGAVIKVKLLACFALINQDAVDWKLIVIDVDDPLSEKLNDLKDVERHCSNLLCGIRRWLRVYGVSDGTPQNQLLFDGDPKGCDFALKIAHHSHDQWKELINRDQNENRTGLSLRNSTVQGSPNKIPERNKLIALFQLVWQKFCGNLRRLVRKVLNFCRELF